MKLYIAALFMVMFLASGVRGDACEDKVTSCDNEVSRKTSAVSSLSNQKPFNLTAALAVCRSVEEHVAQCQREVLSMCPSGGVINATFRSMKNSIRSVCLPDTLCAYEVNQCRPDRSVINEIRDIGHQRPPNATLMLDKCSALNVTVAPCVARLRAGCSNVTTGKNAISSMTSTFKNLCGKSAVCRYQGLECSSGVSGISDIAEAIRQQPPNVQLVMEKCRALDATVAPCVAKLKADCSDVASVASTISSLESSFNGVCGKKNLCQLKMHSCVSLSRGRGHSGQTKAQQCRLQQQINRCLLTDMDDYCRDLPEIKPVINAQVSGLASMKCAQVEETNGGKRAMGRSLLILLLAAYTAGATHLNF